MGPQRVATAPTDSHAPTSREAIRTAPRIHQRRTRRNTPFEEIAEQVQPIEDRAGHGAPVPAAETPTAPVPETGHSENTPPPTLVMQPTIPAIPTSNPKRRGKNRGALKKSRKVLAALVDAQLEIDKQQGIHLITPPSNPNEQFTYHAPNPKGNSFPMPTITQDYNDEDTLEPEVLYPDDQWEEEAADTLPRRSQRLMQTSNFMSCPPAGVSQAALNAFIGNAYMQELQQSMANNATPSGLEEVANGVVHPVTKETITKYKNLLMT